MSQNKPGALTRWLAGAPDALFALYSITAAFSTYFCMYAFRKPFAAASYEGLTLLGTQIDLKTAFVIAQILGYTLSKFVGIKVCSEVARGKRARLLVGLILVAQAALLLFALLPGDLKLLAIFLNGLPLGMVWGLVVAFLEGRRTSELLLAGLSCSFILASGVVKDVGRWLMSAHEVPDFWMPFVTGMVFLLPFVGSVWLLKQLPAPSAEDIAERSQRAPMDARARWFFVQRFGAGLGMLIGTYFFLTAYRDFRDNYGVEIFAELGYGQEPAIFSSTELPVAFGVMLTMAALNLLRDNRRGLMGTFGVMGAGVALIGGSTLLLDLEVISGLVWMICVGLGAYLTYVPFNSVLFDRLIAYTRVTGTAVFAIYLADALGYTGSIGVQLYKDLFQSDATRLDFFRHYSYFMAALGLALLLGAAVYFLRKPSHPLPQKGTQSN